MKPKKVLPSGGLEDYQLRGVSVRKLTVQLELTIILWVRKEKIADATRIRDE